MRLVVIISGLLLLAGCAANHGWDDMTKAEEMHWKELGVSERQAQEYQATGLSAMDVERWRNQGFVNPGDIIRWSKSRFNAFEAASWRNAGFDLDDAIAWAEENFTAVQAQKWVEKGFTLAQALNERAKGLAPTN